MDILRKVGRVLRRINLLSEPMIRHMYVYMRAVYFVRVRGRLRTMQGADVVKANVLHNMKSIYGVNNRMDLLICPVAVIEVLNSDSRILVVGPRNENDLYTLVGLGFRMENIRGLDLISYSPHIELGDMHEMPFPDDSFDAVICGWTLSYSTNPSRAAGEMIRITRPGGIIAVGVEYSTMTPKDERTLLGYEIQEFERTGGRVNSTGELRALFGENIETVFFEHDAPMKVSHTASGLVPNVSNVALVFRLPMTKRASVTNKSK